LIEEETIVLMTTSVDFGVTQVVDGNWGVHADISKWVFDTTDEPYDYACTTSGTAGRRHLQAKDRRELFAKHVADMSLEEYADMLYARVTKGCDTCYSSDMRNLLANKLLDAKLAFARKFKPE
jgi:hypothetical protein